jgi:ATP synthase protein I
MAGPGRESWSGYGTAYAIIGTLLAGMLVWGGVGFLVDRALGTEPLLLAIGLVVGMAGGIYLVYVRYGREHRD